MNSGVSVISARRGRGMPLTRPELAVLIAYAKLTLYSDLLASAVPVWRHTHGQVDRLLPHGRADKLRGDLRALS